MTELFCDFIRDVQRRILRSFSCNLYMLKHSETPPRYWYIRFGSCPRSTCPPGSQSSSAGREINISVNTDPNSRACAYRQDGVHVRFYRLRYLVSKLLVQEVVGPLSHLAMHFHYPCCYRTWVQEQDWEVCPRLFAALQVHHGSEPPILPHQGEDRRRFDGIARFGHL